ncbi:hypothetical protein ONS96_007609 [Cadophora gregata f. sp. sojae]|nr:hypothetical protein ONS96_007609 [Cadophora gregata f. sp. sojae]
MPQASFSEIDMNDPTTLAFYRQLIIFEHDHSRPEVLFPNPSKAEQRAIQALSHSLDLVYEYTLQSKSARVVRQLSDDAQPPSPNQEAEPRAAEEFQDQDFDLSGFDFSTSLDEMLAGISDAPHGICADESTELPSLRQEPSYSQPTSTCATFPSHSSLSEACYSSSPFWDPMLWASQSSPGDSGISPGLELPSLNPDIACAASQSVSHDPMLAVTRERQRAYRIAKLAGLERVSSTKSEAEGSMVFNNSAEDFIDEPSYSLHPGGSRSGSVSSVQSHRSCRPQSRVQKIFRRQSSVNSTASSGYREIIFDSSSTHSAGSGSSFGSAASGRRTPLSEIARAGYNIMRKVGACWRCKFLRKTCDPRSPCAMCPKKSSQHGWMAVGCQRGSFEAREYLCLARTAESEYEDLSGYDLSEADVDLLNRFHSSGNEQRTKDLAEIKKAGPRLAKYDCFQDTPLCELVNEVIGQLCNSEGDLANFTPID